MNHEKDKKKKSNNNSNKKNDNKKKKQEEDGKQAEQEEEQELVNRFVYLCVCPRVKVSEVELLRKSTKETSEACVILGQACQQGPKKYSNKAGDRLWSLNSVSSISIYP